MKVFLVGKKCSMLVRDMRIHLSFLLLELDPMNFLFFFHLVFFHLVSFSQTRYLLCLVYTAVSRKVALQN